MNTIYEESELKILEINVDEIHTSLLSLWAKKVYDDLRTITSYDFIDPANSLKNKWIQLKITEEGTVKMSIDQIWENGHIHSIKNKLWRKLEMEDTLAVLWIQPIASVKARRISYELWEIDIDIDVFPDIPPFCEIDAASSQALQELIVKLWLHENKTTTESTISVFRHYWLAYYELFKIL